MKGWKAWLACRLWVAAMMWFACGAQAGTKPTLEPADLAAFVDGYLAAELGPGGIRVNAISPGPLATRAASGIAHFDQLLAEAAQRAPLRRLVDIDDVGALCVFLAGDAARSITGDTLYVDGVKIRVADIDAPETHDYQCASEKALGDRATARLRQLVNSGTVTLGTIDRDEDRYGRKLRIVMVDGQSVGDTLVGEGLARWYEGGRRPWC